MTDRDIKDYYKQLARKTQECEKLTNKNNLLTAELNQIKLLLEGKNTQYNVKVEECEELKEENQKLEMQLCNDCGERDDYNIPCKMIRDLDYGLQKEIEENDRYRKALEEIEDIVQNHIINDFSNWNMGEISDDIVADYVVANCKQILNIINKAKGEGNTYGLS